MTIDRAVAGETSPRTVSGTKAGDATPRKREVKRLPAAAPLFAGALLCFLICAGLLVYGADRGMDLTDEIFYLIWTRDPDAYPLIYQPFGYVLHPLFKLVRGDLRLYRLSGFAITASAGALLGYSLPGLSRTRAPAMLYAAAAALTIFFPWIITPSYNSAANVGALLLITAILSSLAAGRRFAAGGAVAGAAGLCLAAFSKPPLFAIAVMVMLVTIAVARRARTSMTLAAAVVLAAALISLVFAPADVVHLVARMAASQHILSLPNTPLALPAKIARDWELVPPSLTGSVVAAGLSFAFARYRWSAWLGHAAVALSLWYVGAVAGDAIDGAIPDFLGLALATGTAGYAGVLRRQPGVDLFAVALLLGAPLAVGLGTFNNQWFQFNFSLAFPLVALFALTPADRSRWRRGAAQALAIAGPPLVMALAASHPYSLPASIFAQQVPISHPLARGPILVDPETASFARSARGLARGALLVDLSGTGPGVGALLGGRAPVLAWLNPATGSWPDVVWSRLGIAQRERAWFVGPVWPLFDRSAPARWLVAHEATYCHQDLPPMTFWGERRRLRLWRPCAGAARGLEADRRAKPR